jgi:hypothetical protein
MKKLITVLIPIFFLIFNSSAQAIYLKVKKGSAKFNGSTLSTTAAVKTFESSSKLVVNTQSIVVVKQNKKFLQLAENKTYTYNQILALLKKQKETNSASYLSSLFSDNMQKSTKVVKTGAATRGGSSINWEDVVFEPGKKIILLDTEITLELFSDNVIMIDSLFYTERISLNSRSIKIEDGKKIKIQLSEPGQYDWNTTIKLTDVAENETTTIEGLIIVPDEIERAELLNKWNQFLEDIQSYDTEIQQELIKSYKVENGIFL